MTTPPIDPTNGQPNPPLPQVIYVQAPAAPVAPATNPFVQPTLWLMIASVPLLMCCGLGALTAIAGGITGLLGYQESKRSGQAAGQNVCIAGMAVGVSIPLLALMFVVIGNVNGAFAS
jgi:hypothetical protein